MELDFIPDKDSLYIPKNAYRPAKKCAHCNSVYLSDTHCETCGRSIDFNLVGEPLSVKSFYRIRERYWDELSFITKMYPAFEDRTNEKANSYRRNLFKRFKDLLHGFKTPGAIAADKRKIFYVETKDIVSELVEYEFNYDQLVHTIESNINEHIILTDLMNHLMDQKKNHKKYYHWPRAFLNYKFYGYLRVEFLIQVASVSFLVVYFALKFRHLK